MCCRPWPTPAKPSNWKSLKRAPPFELRQNVDQNRPLALSERAPPAIKNRVNHPTPHRGPGTDPRPAPSAWIASTRRCCCCNALAPPPTRGRAWLLAHDTDALAPEVHGAVPRTVPSAGQAANRWPTSRGARSSMACRCTSTPAFWTRAPTPKRWWIGRWRWSLRRRPPQCPPRIVDLGTGSGAIALALQHQPPRPPRCWRWMPAPMPWPWPQANAQRLALPVQFVQSHWLTGVDGLFDAIVSNPPLHSRPRPPPGCADPMNPCRRWPAEMTGCRTSGRSWSRHRGTSSPGALGCCWNTATTRPKPSAQLAARPRLCTGAKPQ